MRMITALNHITLAVTNIEKSFSFYRDILGFKPVVKWNKGAYFLIAPPDALQSGFWFCLNVDDKRQPNLCYTHYAFSVSNNDFDALAAKIIASGATIFKETKTAERSLYFLDPDGHKLEIHVGDWQTRIAAKKEDQGLWRDVEFFDLD